MGERKTNIDKIKNIIELGRFRFLLAGFFLYIMGCLLAVVSKVPFSIELFIFGYAIMSPAHLSLSYSNNYFDIEVDKYNKPTSISGGSKTLLEHPELRNTCRNIAIILILVSVILSVIFILIYSYSLLLLVFVIFGNLLGWFYAAPPLKLAYRGLGEIANMINMGILMPGFGYWVIKGGFDLFFFVFTFALFLYGLVFIIIVETPDMDGDIKGKKTTIVVKKGRKNTYFILLTSLIIASFYFLFLSIFGVFKEYINFYVVFALSLIPIIIAFIGLYYKPFTKKIATKVAIMNLYTQVIYLFIFNIYLIFLIVLLK
jgi:1,4-dihydroxy-2-naphthoate octaprenyltransferase